MSNKHMQAERKEEKVEEGERWQGGGGRKKEEEEEKEEEIGNEGEQRTRWGRG